MKHPYSIRVFFDPRDKAWVAISDDLPDCSAGGNTPVEAVQEFEIAIEAWLDALEKMGQPIPTPSVLHEADKAIA